MTRRHFKSLANNLANERPEKTKKVRYYNWLCCCQAVARTCQEFNSTFDHDKFITACKEW